jgi:hypothetical protein
VTRLCIGGVSSREWGGGCVAAARDWGEQNDARGGGMESLLKIRGSGIWELDACLG